MFFLKQVNLNYSKLLLFVLSLFVVFGVNANNLPDFSDSAGNVISPELDRRLGKIFLNQIRQFATVINDPEVESYIQSIGYQLASHSDNVEQSFTFFVVLNPSINAFAGPGGVIGINSGVILNSSNESELAAVMAHEIAHVTQRHLARQFEQQNLSSIPTAAALVGAILAAVVNPQAGFAALAGVAGLNVQRQINFTRANEEEADRVGIKTLAKAGFDPRGMPAFFTTLQRLSRHSQSAAPEFLRTHPLTISRISDSITRAEAYPERPRPNTVSYELVRAKLQVNSFKTAKQAVTYFRTEINKHEGSAKSRWALRYGLAYAYIANNDFKHAAQQITKLLSDEPDNVAYLLLAAKAKTAQSKYQQAFEIFKKAHDLFPDYKPVIMAYSRALLDVEKAKQARDLLKNYERYYTHDLRTYALLGQAEAMLGNEIETAFIHAEYYFLAANTKLAIDKLEFIKRKYKLDYYQQQRVDARLADFEYERELEENLNL